MNTHNTREEIDITNKILALIPHIDGFKHSSINHKVDEIIHQQLQKAREEERERIKKIVLNLSKTNIANGTVYYKMLSAYEIKEAIDHSELDQPNK